MHIFSWRYMPGWRSQIRFLYSPNTLILGCIHYELHRVHPINGFHWYLLSQGWEFDLSFFAYSCRLSTARPFSKTYHDVRKKTSNLQIYIYRIPPNHGLGFQPQWIARKSHFLTRYTAGCSWSHRSLFHDHLSRYYEPNRHHKPVYFPLQDQANLTPKFLMVFHNYEQLQKLSRHACERC